MKKSKNRSDCTHSWSPDEEKIFQNFKKPADIQDFLNNVLYSDDPIYRGPRSVIRDRKAHCFDGGVFAAAALRRLGYLPLLLDLRAVRDDDHILALFKYGSSWGAIAKSNFTGLRFREPIFRNLRELALSYFETYYNLEYEKSLRAYSIPLNLNDFNQHHWEFCDSAMDLIADRLDKIRHYPLVSAKQIQNLTPVDQRTYDAGMLGVNMKGVYGAKAKD